MACLCLSKVSSSIPGVVMEGLLGLSQGPSVAAHKHTHTQQWQKIPVRQVRKQVRVAFPSSRVLGFPSTQSH